MFNKQVIIAIITVKFITLNILVNIPIHSALAIINLSGRRGAKLCYRFKVLSDLVRERSRHQILASHTEQV